MVARRAKMDSNWQGERSERASERSERSDQDEPRRVRRQEMQRRDNGVAQATGVTRDSGTTEDAQRFLRMFPRVVKMALKSMLHTCCRDFFLATRFPFYVKASFFLLFFH